MRIITVIPIGRGMLKDTLTYFTREDIANGSVVAIPLRNKKAHGLVVDSQSVSENKSNIKSLSFSMKKIDHVQSKRFLSEAYMKSVHDIADYYATSVGAVLSALLPKAILESSAQLVYTETQKPTDTFYETMLLQEDTEARFATYKSFIREEFARGHSVLFCVPTTEDVKKVQELLHKGIEAYTYIVHAGLSPKQLVSTWNTITTNPHPVLIIGTGSFLSVPRTDLGAVIVEKESSRAYVQQGRPFIDIRTAAKIFAQTLGCKLIYGDNLLRVETLWQEKKGNAVPLSPLVFHLDSYANSRIVSLRESQDFKKKEFALLSQELITLLSHAIEKKEHTFLFCARKGLAPTTVCSDCGTLVACTVCGAPVVLHDPRHSHSKTNTFVCHHCGASRVADTTCAYCGGWRLTTLGIGIDGVLQKVQALFPDTEVIVMDKDHITTHLRAVSARDKFYSTPGSILLGTEMALPYLNQKVEHTAVVSLDSLFSIPDFRISEKIFHILLDMRSVSEKNMIIQTRQKNTTLFEQAIKGNLLDFYRTELEERKAADYPPYTTCIKVTLAGEKKSVQAHMEEIVEHMLPYKMIAFEGFVGGSEHTMHGLIILPAGSWIDRDLLSKLRMLPPSLQVKIDPDTLL